MIPLMKWLILKCLMLKNEKAIDEMNKDFISIESKIITIILGDNHTITSKVT